MSTVRKIKTIEQFSSLPDGTIIEEIYAPKTIVDTYVKRGHYWYSSKRGEHYPVGNEYLAKKARDYRYYRYYYKIVEQPEEA